MLNQEEINKIGQLIDTTFSLHQSTPPNAYTPSIMCRLIDGETLSLIYSSVVNWFSSDPLLPQQNKFANEAEQVTKGYIKRLKESFREETGRILKFEVKNYNDDIQELTSQPYSNKKISLFRRKTLITVT